MSQIITPDYIPSTHQYSVGGVKKISVTQALSLGGIYQPYKNLPASVLEHAAKRGQFLDEWVSNFFFTGELSECPAEYEPWIESFLDWSEFSKVKPIATQTQMYHPVHDYCGTDDLYCELNGIPTELDYKATHRVMSSVRLQTAAYAAIRHHAGQEVQQRAVLHITKSKTKAILFNEPENVNDFRVFISFLNVAKFLRDNP